MSGFSTVGAVQPNGFIQCMYIQCCDDPSEVGEVLERHYKDPKRVDELLLGQDLTKMAPFEPVTTIADEENVLLAQFTGEEPQDTIRDLYFFEDLDLWLSDARECQFAYLFEEGRWKAYEKVLSTRYLKPLVEILSYWIDEKGNRVTKIS